MSKARALLNARLPSGRRVVSLGAYIGTSICSSEILPTPCSLGGRAPIGRSGPPAKREKESLAAMTRQAPRMTGALFCAWDSESVHSRLDGYKAHGLAGRSGSAIRPGTALPRGTARLWRGTCLQQRDRLTRRAEEAGVVSQRGNANGGVTATGDGVGAVFLQANVAKRIPASAHASA